MIYKTVANCHAGPPTKENEMTDENILRAMRMQAWARAKGELHAMAATFFGTPSAREGQFDEFSEKMEEFISYVEGYGLQE